ncbi:MAG TPA: hypothetical protein VND96_11615 [Candidatus Micrarchaeaceae archaeon]|nr:hypothetical protein [Candidatus Micrarchaeaceae archaeon]
MTAKVTWKDAPDAHDYPAAADYLSLLMPQKEADQLVRRLRSAPLVRRKAKDSLRASALPLLPLDNIHVAKDLAKVKKGGLLSPVLMVRGRLDAHVPLTVGDGYQRICASYHVDENADIPCRIVDAR